MSTDVTQISITIPPRSMVLYHNYFMKMSKMRAAGRPESPRHSRTSLALKIDTFSKDFKQKPILFSPLSIAVLAVTLYLVTPDGLAILVALPEDHVRAKWA